MESVTFGSFVFLLFQEDVHTVTRGEFVFVVVSQKTFQGNTEILGDAFKRVALLHLDARDIVDVDHPALVVLRVPEFIIQFARALTMPFPGFVELI